MNTILITGCSSGFGLETARYFLDRGWKVIATMRTPREDLLPRSAHLRILALFRTLVRRGLVPADDVARFLGDLEALDAAGRYFYGITGYAYVGWRRRASPMATDAPLTDAPL